VLPHHDVWDSWPILEEDGSTVVACGAELWMALAVPAVGHPEERHDLARIRLLARNGERWRDLGDVFPDGASPGSREWSGSAVRRADGTVSVFYTATGVHGESRPTFRQQVVEARARLTEVDGVVHLDPRVEHRVVLRGESPYLPADEIEGGAGRIRAFRDPGWFRDPADGREYLLIAASMPSGDHFTGAVALAVATATGWDLRPPLLVSEGVNHEIERPHIVVHQGRYYLFFCTSSQAFDPAGTAPTGLYGFVAPTLTGPYEPLNGSGLVIRNPPAQPDQAYAWLVLPDRSVESFVNYLPAGGGDPRLADAVTARASFGGTAAPTLHLALGETSTELVKGRDYALRWRRSTASW